MKTKIIYILVMAMIISLCSGGACFAQETSADAGSEITDEAGSDTTPPAEEIKAPAAPEGVKAQVKTISNNIKEKSKELRRLQGVQIQQLLRQIHTQKNHQRQQDLLYGQKTQIQQNLQIQGMRLQAAGK